MIDNDYYYNVLEQYTLEEIEELHKKVYSYNFEFQSYIILVVTGI